MATAEAARTFTPEDLLALPDRGKGYELVDGNLVELDVSALSSWVGGQLFRRVDAFGTERDLGLTWPAESGLRCFPRSPNTVRKPDMYFVRKSRLPLDWQGQGFLRVVPDLIGEVISPGDLAYEVEERIAEFVEAAVQLLWIVDPQNRTARIHRADGTFNWLKEDGTLDGEDILPGFHLPLRDLFPPVPAKPA
jgi:Uma2 family endonuclease